MIPDSSQVVVFSSKPIGVNEPLTPVYTFAQKHILAFIALRKQSVLKNVKWGKKIESLYYLTINLQIGPIQS